MSESRADTAILDAYYRRLKGRTILAVCPKCLVEAGWVEGDPFPSSITDALVGTGGPTTCGRHGLMTRAELRVAWIELEKRRIQSLAQSD